MAVSELSDVLMAVPDSVFFNGYIGLTIFFGHALSDWLYNMYIAFPSQKTKKYELYLFFLFLDTWLWLCWRRKAHCFGNFYFYLLFVQPIMIVHFVISFRVLVNNFKLTIFCIFLIWLMAVDW